MKNQIRGSIKINARGRNLYKFINRIHSEKIYCFQQYVKAETFCAEIYRHDLKKLESIAEEYQIEIKSFEYSTLSSQIINHKRRIGILIGLIVVITASVYFSGVIVTIEVQGNEKVSSTTILNTLEEIGISIGTSFRKIDYVWSENELRLLIDDIAWAGMHRTGHRLVVEVTEVVEKPEMLNERMPCNIISSHDAYITYTSVLDGQLMKKVGDYVLKGEMLVTGVTSDSTGHTTLHHAMADIIGRYKETISFDGNFTKERFVATGEIDTRRTLKLFSLYIPLYLGQNKYEYKEYQFTEKPFSIFENILPISIQKEVYTELERTETTITEEELSEELMEKVYLYEKNFLSDCEIIERDVSQTIVEDVMTITVNYEIEGSICDEMEIMIK